MSNISNIDEMNDDELWDLFDNIDTENDEQNSETLDSEEITSDINNCEHCDASDSLTEDKVNGFIVCKSCGAIDSDLMDYNPEWKSYGDDGNNGRCAMATNFFLPKSSLGTTMAGSNYNRLKRLQNWGAMPYRERTLYGVMDDISTRCEKNGITKNIIDDAKLMYKKISECKYKDGKNEGKYMIIRGSNRRSLIAACVFYACKRNECTRSTKEMARIFDLKLTEMTKGCKKFIYLVKTYYKPYNMDSSTPEHFVRRYCIKLKIHNNDIQVARTIAQNVKKLGLASDHTPPSVAAGSILLMSKMNNLSLTKKNISNTFEISEVTISKIYKKIEEYGMLLINTEETDKLLMMINSDSSLYNN